MARLPSTETQLRNAHRQLREARGQVATLERTAETYRQRATKAEQEVAEWKRRFNALLARTPKSVPSSSGSED